MHWQILQRFPSQTCPEYKTYDFLLVHVSLGRRIPDEPPLIIHRVQHHVVHVYVLRMNINTL